MVLSSLCEFGWFRRPRNSNPSPPASTSRLVQMFSITGDTVLTGTDPGVSTFAEFQKTARANREMLIQGLDAAAVKLDAELDVLNTLSEKFGVFCLSGDPLQPLMWAHYASSHTGMLIEFDAIDPLFNNRAFLKVEYHADRVEYDASGPPNRDAVEQFARRKSPDWDYEQESRLIIELSLTRTVPGTPPMFLFPIEAKLIKSVTLGLRSSTALRAGVLVLASAPPLQHIEVFRIEADANAFKLHRKQIK